MEFQEKYQNMWKQLHSDVTVEQIQEKAKKKKRTTRKNCFSMLLFLVFGFLTGMGAVTMAADKEETIELNYIFKLQEQEVLYVSILGEEMPQSFIISTGNGQYEYDLPEVRLLESDNHYYLEIEKEKKDITELLTWDDEGNIRFVSKEGYHTVYQTQAIRYAVNLFFDEKNEKMTCEVNVDEK